MGIPQGKRKGQAKNIIMSNAGLGGYLCVTEGNLRGDFQSIRRQCDEFSRVICEDSHRMDSERREDLRPHPILSLFTLEPDGLVRIDASLSMRLEFCRPRLAHRMKV